jgi:KaiC/GvpD/RAD55 family RecA-like ATPase
MNTIPTGIDALDDAINGGFKPGHLVAIGGRTNAGRSMMDIIPTGIENLDDILGGGLKRGSVTPFLAATGAGKTILATNISKNKNFKSLYITCDESEELIYKKIGKDTNTNVMNLSYGSGVDELKYTIDAMNKYKTVDVIIIDRIDAFRTSYQDTSFMKYAATTLYTLAHQYGCAIVVNIAMMKEQLGDEDTNNSLRKEYISDFHFISHDKTLYYISKCKPSDDGISIMINPVPFELVSHKRKSPVALTLPLMG